MAKLKLDPISQADVQEFIKGSSDFDFELQVLKKLKLLGLECQHSGLYEDPVKEKNRQFDIQATFEHENKVLHLAVECKNFRANAPLLAYCVPRTTKESFHEVIVVRPSNPYDSNQAYININVPILRVSLTDEGSIYTAGRRVAKVIDQVAKNKDGEFLYSDEQVHDKISQALHSSYDILQSISTDDSRENKAHVVLPVLVIPDDRLWEVTYDEDGIQQGEIKQIQHATYWVNQYWYIEKTKAWTFGYQISHLEIVSYSMLHDFIIDRLDKKNNLKACFPNNVDEF